MADKSVSVRLVGLESTVRAIGWVNKDINHRLRDRLGAIAQRIAGRARAKVPMRSGTAAGSIVGRSTERGAGIAFGGRAAPYMPWLNFGGRVGRQKHVRRSIVKPDRYIYATVIAAKEETLAAVEDAVAQAAKEAGFEVRG